jgi:hypothetical protein
VKTLLLGFALLSGCTATKAVIITGETADQVGRDFILASNAMQAAQAQGRVSKEEFLVWANFSSRFDIFFGRGVDALKAARAIHDDIAAHDIGAAVGRLAVELAGHYEGLKRSGLLPKGAP